MAKEYCVAVVGATGVVGTEMINVLEQRNFPVAKLKPLASKRSTGKQVEYKGKKINVEVLTKDSFGGIDVALFSAGGKISKEFAPAAVDAGAVVVDNTSHFRMDPKVPLVVPEVNAEDIKKHKGIIANPNCSTAQMVLVLKPIHDAYKIKRVVVATYQSTSGAGKEAMDELREQTAQMLAGKGIGQPKKISKPIGFNVVPHIDVFQDNDYTKEEMKMTLETQKIMGDESIQITATCVRVPVFIGHSEAINIETEKEIGIEDVRKLLNKFPGVEVVDNPKNLEFPTPLDCSGKDETFVGRIRKDISHPRAIELWCVSDNLRKGAALNAVQIAEELVKQGLM